MAAIEVAGLTHRFGGVTALDGIDLSVPEGSVFALVGPNGAGKTTLLRVVLGLLRPAAGEVVVRGVRVEDLEASDRASIGYVAEGQRLPSWMTLRQMESYVSPLYPTWDGGLADDLRRRFHLDGGRRIGTLSRGEHMKAALLCALAARPRLLLMDEPFSGMDALVKDELVRGLLASAAGGGSTVMICSHDLSELEPLADHVGFLRGGRLLFAASIEDLHDRYVRVEVVTREVASAPPAGWPAAWLSVGRNGRRVSILAEGAGAAADEFVRQHVPDATRIERRPATLKEIFLVLAADPARREAAEAV